MPADSDFHVSTRVIARVGLRQAGHADVAEGLSWWGTPDNSVAESWARSNACWDHIWDQHKLDSWSNQMYFIHKYMNNGQQTLWILKSIFKSPQWADDNRVEGKQMIGSGTESPSAHFTALICFRHVESQVHNSRPTFKGDVRCVFGHD